MYSHNDIYQNQGSTFSFRSVFPSFLGSKIRLKRENTTYVLKIETKLWTIRLTFMRFSWDNKCWYLAKKNQYYFHFHFFPTQTWIKIELRTRFSEYHRFCLRAIRVHATNDFFLLYIIINISNSFIILFLR